MAMPNFSALLLLTRPLEASKTFAEQVLDGAPCAFQPVLSPLLDIVPCGDPPDLDGKAGLIFTSFRAVSYAGPPHAQPVYCVGAETKRHLESAGWSVAIQAPDVERLYQALINEKPPTPLLHIAGAHRRGALAARLTEAGLATEEAIVYTQEAAKLTDIAIAALTGELPVLVPLFSPRTAEIFAAQCHATAPLHLIGISEAALGPVADIPAVTRISAARPDAASMRQTVHEVLRRVETRQTPL